MSWIDNHPRYKAAATSDSDSNFSSNINIATEDVEKRDLLEQTLIIRRGGASRRERLTQFCRKGFFVTFNIIILLLSLASLYRTEKIKNDTERNQDNIAMKKTSYYSPVQNSLPLSFHDVKFNGSLFSRNSTAESIYRLPPSPEVDEAWERISNVGTIVISSSDVERLGKDPKTAVKYPKSWGYGADAYVGFVDGFHQIHCLDVLRRSASVNSAYYSNHHSKSHHANHAFDEAHVQHCVYTLLQNLMCSANTDVITYNWVKGQEHPFPDFDTNHKCRDFDALVKWQYRNRVDYEKTKTLVRPKGEEAKDIVELPAPDEGVDQS